MTSFETTVGKVMLHEMQVYSWRDGADSAMHHLLTLSIGFSKICISS
jgi:hypothetical protein